MNLRNSVAALAILSALPASAAAAPMCNPVISGSDRPVTAESGNEVLHAGSTECPAEPAPPAPAPAPAAAAPAPAPEKVLFTISSDVAFDFDRAELKPQFQGELDRIAASLAREAGAKLAIDGHADAVGTDAYNLGLSERRARAVAEYLVARGIAPDRLTVRAYGEARPVASNDDEEGRARNRRVEIVTR